MYIEFAAKPGYLYKVLFTTNYVGWDTQAQLRTVSTRLFETRGHSVPLDRPFGVTRVEETKDP